MIKKSLIAASLLLLASTVQAQTLGTTTRIPEGTCTAGASTIDTLCANANDHSLAQSLNNGTYEGVPVVYYTTATFTNGTATPANVTGLAFGISANRTYHAICHIVWQGSVSTAGPQYQFTGPSGSTASLSSLTSSTTVTTFATATASTYATSFQNTQAVTANTNLTDLIEFTVINGATAGTVQLQAAAAGSGTFTIQRGSSCQVQ